MIDARTNEQFDEAHIPGAISASAYDTGFATKVARVAPAGAELIVVAASDGYEREAAELLAAVGLRVRGFLEGGMTAWRSEERPVKRIELIDPDELARAARGRRRRRSSSTSATPTSSPASTSPARSTSPTASSPAASTSCPASARSRRSAAAASAAAWPPRSCSARASTPSSTSARASASGAHAGHPVQSGAPSGAAA